MDIQYETIAGMNDWVVNKERIQFPVTPIWALKEMQESGVVDDQLPIIVEAADPFVFLIITKDEMLHLAAPVIKKKEGGSKYKPYWAVFKLGEQKPKATVFIKPKEVIAYTVIDLKRKDYYEISELLRKKG